MDIYQKGVVGVMPQKKRKQRTVKYTTYRKNFENMVKKGVVVKGFKYDKYVEETVNLEDYKQCYKPGFRPREEMPKYWFISKEGFLINARGKNLTFVQPNLKLDRPQFKPNGKTISSYGLVGLVWGSYIEPDAYTFMHMNGIACIGKNPKIDENGHIKGKVQPHHFSKEGYLQEKTLENYILNNRPEYIEFLTNKDHRLIGGFTGDITKDLEKMVDAEYKYNDVPQEHIKVFAYKQTNTKTGQDTKISKVLTTDEANSMKYIPISAYVISENKNKSFKSRKVGCISVQAKEKKDIEAYMELPQDEKIELQNYLNLLFKHNKDLKEVEFRYKTISMIATREV